MIWNKTAKGNRKIGQQKGTQKWNPMTFCTAVQ